MSRAIINEGGYLINQENNFKDLKKNHERIRKISKSKLEERQNIYEE